jgi:putative glutamine amidotransferase
MVPCRTVSPFSPSGAAGGRLPLIGVSTSISVDQRPERAYVNSAYLRAVQDAGGVPVALPPQLAAAARETLLRAIDALLLTGGGDMDPACFGEAPHATVYDVAPARDALEVEAVRVALERGVPVLAVCRGVQVLNVALGGTLHQDVETDPGTSLQHSQQKDGVPRDEPTHKVRIEPESRLAQVMGTDAVEVNSMHHQAVKTLGAGLRAVAWAPDQIVEGVEHTDPVRFVLGVQWHPEELVGRAESARRLFAALVDAAIRR